MPCDTSIILTRLLEAARETRDPHRLGTQLVLSIREAMPQASWVGVYWLRGDELVLGPFVGAPTEHVRISLDRGVCGLAVREDEDQVVDDVRSAPHYLACSPDVRSEIVVLLRAHGRVIGQVDLDSEAVGAFDSDHHCILRAVADSFSGLIDVEALDTAPEGVCVAPPDAA
jgi:GAF domain-containing protein